MTTTASTFNRPSPTVRSLSASSSLSSSSSPSCCRNRIPAAATITTTTTTEAARSPPSIAVRPLRFSSLRLWMVTILVAIIMAAPLQQWRFLVATTKNTPSSSSSSLLVQAFAPSTTTFTRTQQQQRCRRRPRQETEQPLQQPASWKPMSQQTLQPEQSFGTATTTTAARRPSKLLSSSSSSSSLSSCYNFFGSRLSFGQKRYSSSSSSYSSSSWPQSQGQAQPRHFFFTSSSFSRPVSSSLSAAATGFTPVVTSFDDGVRPFQITTPIYYVNDKPHIGHAYTSVACDVLARFWRLSGREVYFVSGTDEHGQKVQQSAQTRNMEPQEFVDTMSQTFVDLLQLLNISNDVFIRTTDAHHKAAAQHLWNVLVEKGFIYLDTYSGWYSVRDECFYTESELVNGNAPTGAAVEWVAKEESYFFRLSALESDLLQFYDEHPDFMAPESRRNEVVNFVTSGLRDLSISRTSFEWGVPVPNQDDDNDGDDDDSKPHHVMYVWMDALANYLSALGYPEDKEGRVEKFWPAALHVVGKDILRFHAVYWPAFLMAADLPVPKRLFAHGWWTKDGQKISKSIGNVIDPVELCEKYGVDQTRFFLMAEVAFGNDGDFSDRDMVLKVNSNLANELGNLCQRVLSMIFKNCQEAVPQPADTLTAEDEALLASASSLWERSASAIAEQAILTYVQVLVQLIWDANKYIDEQAPWSLRKTDPARADTVLYVLMEVLRHAAIMYQPLIPTSANNMLDQLTVPPDQRTFAHLQGDEYKIRPGAPISKPQAIFPRLEVPAEGTLVETK